MGLPSDGKGHEWTLGWILPEMLQAVTPRTSPPALRAVFPEEGSSWRWPQGMGRPWCRRTRGPRSMGVNSLRAPVGGTLWAPNPGWWLPPPCPCFYALLHSVRSSLH